MARRIKCIRKEIVYGYACNRQQIIRQRSLLELEKNRFQQKNL